MISHRRASFSVVKPASSTTVPLESEAVITRAPNCIAFSIAYCATFPDPDTATRIPSKPNPWRFNIASVK
ncbi:hypothetical protein D3C87_2007320 [compost metagenome]